MSNGIVLPRLYFTANAPQPMTDAILDFDQVARSAIEVGRAAYNPLPAGSGDVYAAFFSKENYAHLYKTAKRLSRGEPDPGELFEAMTWAYSTVQPRGDEMDERRNLFGPDMVESYIKEMNRYVLEKVVTDIEASNQLWATYARYRNGPIDFQAEDDGYIDTRTRFQGSRIDMSYLIP